MPKGFRSGLFYTITTSITLFPLGALAALLEPSSLHPSALNCWQSQCDGPDVYTHPCGSAHGLPGTAELQLWGLDTHTLLLANMFSLLSALQPRTHIREMGIAIFSQEACVKYCYVAFYGFRLNHHGHGGQWVASAYLVFYGLLSTVAQVSCLRSKKL